MEAPRYQYEAEVDDDDYLDYGEDLYEDDPDGEYIEKAPQMRWDQVEDYHEFRLRKEKQE